MNLKLIKKYLSSRIGDRVSIVYYGSRNKKERYVGIIYKTYYNVFTIKLMDGSIKCFSYIDILTKTIQIYI